MSQYRLGDWPKWLSRHYQIYRLTDFVDFSLRGGYNLVLVYLALNVKECLMYTLRTENTTLLRVLLRKDRWRNRSVLDSKEIEEFMNTQQVYNPTLRILMTDYRFNVSYRCQRNNNQLL